MDADVIVVGAGLAGLVATHELTSRGKKVAVVDQENAANLGGQAFWSFGGLFLVNSPQQRRLGVTDSVERSWLAGHGIRFLPTVGWAERGDLSATGHGNSVPRFHVAWGTGTGVVAPFVASAHRAAEAGLVTFYHRHRVDELLV